MDLFHNLFRAQPASPGQKNEEVELPAPVAEPPEDPPTPRPPLPMTPRLAETPQRFAPFPQSGGPAEEMVLLLGDVLSRVPTDALQPGMHDPDLKLRFSVSDLLPGFSRGRAAIPLSLLAQRYPAVFRAPETAAHETNVYLPLQKLIQQVRGAGADARKAGPIPPVERAEPAAEIVSEPVAPAPTSAPTPEPEALVVAAAPPEPAPAPGPRVEAPAAPVVSRTPEEKSPAPSEPVPVVARPEARDAAPVAPPPAPVSQAVPPAPTIPSIFPEFAPAAALTRPEPAKEAGIRIVAVPPLIRAPVVSGPSGAVPRAPVEPPPEPAPVAIPPLNLAPRPAPPAAEPAAIPEPANREPEQPLPDPLEPAAAKVESQPEPEPAGVALEEPITVTPAPVPSESTPATVPALDYYLDQEPLQAIFMTDEALDLLRVSELSARLPGITGCMVLAGESFTQGGERPTGLDAATLRELSAKLANTLESIESKLPAEPTFTLYGGNRALSIFARGEVSLCVVHAPRGFFPGVRERLAAVADILARCLGGEEPEELPQEA